MEKPRTIRPVAGAESPTTMQRMAHRRQTQAGGTGFHTPRSAPGRESSLAPRFADRDPSASVAQDLKLLYFHSRPELAPQLRDMAEFLGIPTACVSFADGTRLSAALEEVSASNAAALVFDVAGLADQLSSTEAETIAGRLESCELPVLLLVTQASDAASRMLNILTRSIVQNVVSGEFGDNIHFPASSRFAGELSSFSYAGVTKTCLSLVVERKERVEVVMELDARPVFLRTRLGKADLFVWSTSGNLRYLSSTRQRKGIRRASRRICSDVHIYPLRLWQGVLACSEVLCGSGHR